MGVIRDLGRRAWRKYNTDGVASSGFNKPSTDDIFPFVDAVESQVEAAVQGMVRKDTWTALNAQPGTRNGQPGEATTGSGTHTDPVTGDTVPNKGAYSWSTSPAGWKWVGELIDPTGIQTQIDALDTDKAEVSYVDSNIATVTTSIAAVAAVESDRRQHPNVFTDAELDFSDTTRVASSTKPTATTRNGNIVAQLTAAPGTTASTYWRFSKSDLVGLTATSQRVSATAVVEGVEAGTGGGGNVRMMVRQINAGVEIVAAREEFNIAVANAVSSPVSIPLPNITLDEACTDIDIYFDISATGSSTSRSMWVRRLMLAAGRDATYRAPPAINEDDRDSTTELAKGLASQQPNLFTQGELDFSDTSRVNSGSTYSIATQDGLPCYSITTPAGASSPNFLQWDFPRSAFDTSMLSGSIRVLRADAATAGGGGTTAVLYIRQFNELDQEITAARRTVIFCGLQGLPKAKTFRFKEVPIDSACVRIGFYVAISVAGGSAARTIRFRDMMMAWGPNPYFRAPYIGAAGLGTLYVSPTGSDPGGTGSPGNPYASPAKAAAMLNGVGDVVFKPGTFPDGLQVDRTIIKDLSLIGDTDSSLGRPKLRYGTKATGITKTAGRTKIYQFSISLPGGSPNWIWQDGVNDLTTSIASARKWSAYRDRSYRLPGVRIFKAIASSTSAALDELDAASTPKMFYDASNQRMYFTIQGGGDGSAANIYVAPVQSDFDKGIISNAPAFWSGQTGKLRVSGLDIFYGNVNFRPFRKWEADDVRVFGPAGNCFDVAFWGELKRCEGAGAGSGFGPNGDGASAHNFAEWSHKDCLFHDNFDDGESSHEGCRVEGSGGWSEYNGGNGLIAALGGWARYQNMRTGFNAIYSYNTNKYGGIAAINAGTVVLADNCISENEPRGFYDTAESTSSRLDASRSEARNSTTFGFDCSSARNCSYSGTGTAKSSRTSLITSTALS